MSDLRARLLLEAEAGQMVGEMGRADAAAGGLESGMRRLDGAAKEGAAGVGQLGGAAEMAAADLGTLFDASQRDFVGQYSAGVAQLNRLGESAELAAADLGALYDASQRDFVGQYGAGVAELNRLGEAAEMAAADLGTLYDAAQRDFVSQYTAGMNRTAKAHVAVGQSARVTSNEMLNLSRQASDVGVTLAMGMSPLMILVQQGPQIADVFATAAQRGLTFKQVLQQIAVAAWTAVAPLAPFVAGAAALAAVIGGGLALATRKINQDNKDFAKGLGLTADQLERVKDKSITMGDVVKGTFSYLGKAAAPLLQPIGDFFTKLFDDITKGLVVTIKAIVGGFIGGFGAVKAVWSNLNPVLADISRSTVNSVIAAIEKMINLAIAGMNRLVDAAKSIAKGAGITLQVGKIQDMALGRVPNSDTGAAKSPGDAAAVAWKQGLKAGDTLVDGFFKGVNDSVLDASKARMLKEAGKATKTAAAKVAHTPRDQTDEREAEIAGAIAQAMQAELQARLGLTREAAARASIEKQILAAQVAEKRARIAAQVARIADDKGLSDAKKAELIAQYEGLKAIEDRTARLQEQAIDESLSEALARESLDRRIAGKENEIDLLASQANLSSSTYARNLIEVDILRAQQEIERLKLEEIIHSATSTVTEKAIAESRLKTLSAVQANELAAAKLDTGLVDAIGEATDAVYGFKNALRRHDWAGVFDQLRRTIQTIQASFAANGLGGGLLTAGSAAASLIGGKGGRIAGNALGIAGLGVGLGTLATGASLGSVGLVTGLTGSAALGGAFGSGLAALGAAAPPLALAAAALYAAAKIFNIGGKPSNKGAGYDLVTGAITGKSRDSETEQAAVAAGDAIKGIQDSLKAAGISLGDVVTGLVIGTRDQTQIYLQSGKTLLSAVGDSGAAVDAALRGVLEGATFVSDAQKSLVEGMLAAGKGFDDIALALQGYAQAQGLMGQIDDAILQLTDPKAWKLEELRRAQEAERAGLKAAADAGYLTAEQFAAAGAKLSILEALQLDDVLKSFGDALGDATQALRDQAAELQGTVGDRILELTNPDAFKVKRVNDDIDGKIAAANPLIAAGVLGADFLDQLEQLRSLELASAFGLLGDQVGRTVDVFAQARPALQKWLDQLAVGVSAELSPRGARDAAAEQYQRELAKARSGDADALSGITSYADRLLSADRTATSSSAARLALANQVKADIAGLTGLSAGGGGDATAAILAALQAPLATIAQASTADLAALAAGGKPVVIANLPSIQAIYGQTLTSQTDRLVAANDRSREEIVAGLKMTADKLEAAIAGLGGALGAGLAAQGEAALAVNEELRAAIRGLEAEAALANAEQRARGRG